MWLLNISDFSLVDYRIGSATVVGMSLNVIITTVIIGVCSCACVCMRVPLRTKIESADQNLMLIWREMCYEFSDISTSVFDLDSCFVFLYYFFKFFCNL